MRAGPAQRRGAHRPRALLRALLQQEAPALHHLAVRQLEGPQDLGGQRRRQAPPRGPAPPAPRPRPFGPAPPRAPTSASLRAPLSWMRLWARDSQSRERFSRRPWAMWHAPSSPMRLKPRLSETSVRLQLCSVDRARPRSSAP